MDFIVSSTACFFLISLFFVLVFDFSEIIGWIVQYQSLREYFFNNMVKGKAMKQTKGLYPAPLTIADVRALLLQSFWLKQFCNFWC